MKSSTKLFLLMSFFACIGSSLLNALERQGQHLKKEELEELKQKLTKIIGKNIEKMYMQELRENLSKMYYPSKKEIRNLEKFLQEAPVLTTLENKDIFAEEKYMCQLNLAVRSRDTVLIKELLESAPIIENNKNKKMFDHYSSGLFDFNERNKLLFDKHIALHNQARLIQKMVFYLQKEGRDSEVIEKIQNITGVCAALSFLWGYGKRLQDEPIIDSTIERDDYEFFNKMYRTLAIWDGSTPFTNDQKKDIDRFISNIMLYQSEYMLFDTNWHYFAPSDTDRKREDTNIDQEDFIISSGNTKKETLKTAFLSISFHSSSKLSLMFYLKLYVKPKEIFVISAYPREGQGHATALYQSEDGAMFYYDPNDDVGEKAIYSIEQLADEIWNVSDVLCGASVEKREFDFIGYQFPNDITYVSPSENKEDCLLLINQDYFLHEPFLIQPFCADVIIQVLQQPDVSDEHKRSIVQYEMTRDEALLTDKGKAQLQKIKEYIKEHFQEML